MKTYNDPKMMRAPMDGCTVILKYIGRQKWPNAPSTRLWNVMNGKNKGATWSIEGLRQYGVIQ